MATMDIFLRLLFERLGVWATRHSFRFHQLVQNCCLFDLFKSTLLHVPTLLLTFFFLLRRYRRRGFILAVAVCSAWHCGGSLQPSQAVPFLNYSAGVQVIHLQHFRQKEVQLGKQR